MTNPATTSLLDRANLDRDSVRREIARGIDRAHASRILGDELKRAISL